MDKESMLDSLSQISDAAVSILTSQIGNTAPNVPTCPDWNVNDLILHIGRGQRWATKIVQDKLTEPFSFGKETAKFINLPSEKYLAWLDSKVPPEEPISGDLVRWFEEGSNHMIPPFGVCSASQKPRLGFALPVWKSVSILMIC
jgi:Mycothiol maleylpyruvate isomerase N-terminal domain